MELGAEDAGVVQRVPELDRRPAGTRIPRHARSQRISQAPFAGVRLQRAGWSKLASRSRGDLSISRGEEPVNPPAVLRSPKNCYVAFDRCREAPFAQGIVCAVNGAIQL